MGSPQALVALFGYLQRMDRRLSVAYVDKGLLCQEPLGLVTLAAASAHCPFSLPVSSSMALPEHPVPLVVAARKGSRERQTLLVLRWEREEVESGMPAKLCPVRQWSFEYWQDVFEPFADRQDRVVELESWMRQGEEERQRIEPQAVDCQLLESANLACISLKVLSSASLRLWVCRETFRPCHDAHCGNS